VQCRQDQTEKFATLFDSRSKLVMNRFGLEKNNAGSHLLIPGRERDMEDEAVPEQVELGLHSVADQLREGREALSLSVEDVAAKTRIPLRHLLAIEASRYGDLPGKTYAIGFAKSYARAVNLDETKIAQALRGELGDHGSPYAQGEDAYEPVSASRLPSRAMALTAAGIAVILMIAYAVWRSSLIGGTASETPIAATAEDAVQTASTAPAKNGAAPAAGSVAADAPIVITASSEVWMGFNDPAANGRLVFERTFKSGESYTVPAEARGWTMRTSRPQAIQITVAGKAMPQMGKDDLLVKDIPLNAVELVKKASEVAAAPAPAVTN
jgi:cytoskeleton protein RodZ